MDALSLATGFFGGVLATLAILGVLVFARVRRTLRGLSVLRPHVAPSILSGVNVETDAEGYILSPQEEPEA